ncbi:MAG: hypothetical protein J4F40_08150 [Alphaproteobacteria bacterium]|nr:hypothetical protein [Alphaproteobacteria bacterium]
MERYLSSLSDWLSHGGFGQDLLIMTNNGGVAVASHIARFPVTAVLSGPAGGGAAGLFLSRQLGIDNFITCDMGGTSTDVCLIKKRQPASAAQRIVSGLPLRFPQLGINTVGAGGGSVAWVDTDGRSPWVRRAQAPFPVRRAMTTVAKSPRSPTPTWC